MILVTVLYVCVLDVHADDPLFIYDNPQTGYSVYINDAYDLLTEEEEANPEMPALFPAAIRKRRRYSTPKISMRDYSGQTAACFL